MLTLPIRPVTLFKPTKTETQPTTADAASYDQISGIDIAASSILDLIVGVQGDLVDTPNVEAETGRYTVHERFQQKLITLSELVMARVIQGGHLMVVLKTHPPEQETVQWYRYQAMLAETLGVRGMHEYIALAQREYAAALEAGQPPHCLYGSRGWHPAEIIYQMIKGLATFGRGMNILQTPTTNLRDGYGMDGSMTGLSALSMLAEYKKAGVQRVYVHGPFTDSMVLYAVKACRLLGLEAIVLQKTTDTITPEALQQGLSEIKAAGGAVL